MQLTPEQAKSIVDAIQEADFPQAFERLDSYGPTGPEINLLRKEFISGRYGFDFAGRFQLAVNALAGTNFAISQKEYDYYRQPTKANFKRMLAQDMDEAIRLALELLSPVEAQYRAEFDGLIQVAGRRNGLKEDKLNGVLRQEDERVGQAQVLQSLTSLVNKLPEDLFQGWQRPSPAPDPLPKSQMLGGDGFEFDLFFSFSSQNKAAATQIVQTLRGNGLRIFFSDEDLQHHAGQSFFEKINYALKHSEHFVLYCTPAAMQSGWVKQEYSSFYQHSHLPSQEARRFFVLAGEGFRLDLLPLMLRNLQVSPSVDDVLRALGRELVPDDLPERQADYQELVELFFADGVISALERRQLQKKQRDTKLTDAQVASIEAGVTLAWQTQHAEEERKRIEAEKLRQEELAEQERLQKEKEEIRKQKEAEEAEKLRQEKEAEEERKRIEAEKLRQEELAEQERLQKEKEEIRKQKEAEEAEKLRQEKEAKALQLQKEKEEAEEGNVWRAAQQAGSEAAYFDYTRRYPYGRYFNQANDQIRRIRAEREAQARQRYFEEAEHRFSLAKAQRDPELLRDLVARYPESPLVPQAQALLAKLAEEEEAEKLRLEKLAKEQRRKEEEEKARLTGTPTGSQTGSLFPKKWLLSASLGAMVLVAVLLFTFREAIFGEKKLPNTEQQAKTTLQLPDNGKKQPIDTAGPDLGQVEKTAEYKPEKQEKPVAKPADSQPDPETNTDPAEEKDWQGLGKPEKINLERLEKFLDKYPNGRKAIQARTLREKLRGRYQKALQNGDASYALEDYANAVKYYRAALALKPNDTKLREKIRAVEELQKPDY